MTEQRVIINRQMFHRLFRAIVNFLKSLPQPPYTGDGAQELAGQIYSFVFQQALAGAGSNGRPAA